MNAILRVFAFSLYATLVIFSPPHASAQSSGAGACAFLAAKITARFPVVQQVIRDQVYSQCLQSRGQMAVPGANSAAINSGTYTTFDVPGSTVIYPVAINPEGEIIGYYFDPPGAHAASPPPAIAAPPSASTRRGRSRDTTKMQLAFTASCAPATGPSPRSMRRAPQEPSLPASTRRGRSRGHTLSQAQHFLLPASCAPPVAPSSTLIPRTLHRQPPSASTRRGRLRGNPLSSLPQSSIKASCAGAMVPSSRSILRTPHTLNQSVSTRRGRSRDDHDRCPGRWHRLIRRHRYRRHKRGGDDHRKLF
jgi:hypothetical protein